MIRCKIKGLAIVSFLLICNFVTTNAGVWESKLYPSGESGYTRAVVIKDSLEYRLPDFSYAGYQRGEQQIPHVSVSAVLEPVSGCNSEQINRAIRRLSRRRKDENGFRGAILLSQGMYEITDEINIYSSGIVLRGEGPDKTFLYVNSTRFARKSAVKAVGPQSSDWSNYPRGERAIPMVADADDQATSVVVESRHRLSVGDDIIIRQRSSVEFSKAHGGDGRRLWPASNDNVAPKFARTITAVAGDTIYFDEPIRYPLKTKYGAFVFKAEFLTNVGIENLAIGFVEGLDTKNGGTTHRATAIMFSDVKDGWIRGVHSFKRDDNSVHLQSYGFAFRACKSITVEDCILRDPQNKNVGGNGYLYNPVMSDGILFKNCEAHNGRHNFTFVYPSSGNVVTGCYSTNSRSDLHQYLASENLFDNMTIKGDSITAGNRDDKSQGAWWTSTKTVFWNIMGSGAIYLNSYDRGYAIGVEPGIRVGKGPVNLLQDFADTYHTDRQWIERKIQGELKPYSLYEAQLQQRLKSLAE